MRSRINVKTLLVTAMVLFTVSVIGCEKHDTAEFKPEILPLPEPLARYEAMEVPADNPTTLEKAALGRQLFFDKRLSVDGSR